MYPTEPQGVLSPACCTSQKWADAPQRIVERGMHQARLALDGLDETGVAYRTGPFVVVAASPAARSALQVYQLRREQVAPGGLRSSGITAMRVNGRKCVGVPPRLTARRTSSGACHDVASPA